METIGLTVSYPETVFSKLFSSVPRREFAIRNITISFTYGDAADAINIDGCLDPKYHPGSIVLLVGASASGKSTLLRTLCGLETPTNGKILINKNIEWPDKGVGDHEHKKVWNNPTFHFTSIPILIDRVDPCDDSRTVNDWIEASFEHLESSTCQVNEHGLKSILVLKNIILNALALTTEQLQGNPSSLSLSGQYLVSIAYACCQSIRKNDINYFGSDNVDGNKLDALKKQPFLLHSPMLLLDELFDQESYTVAANIVKGLQRLVDAGCIVICATHKKHHFKSNALCKRRVITMNSGEVLSDRYLDASSIY